MQTFLLYINWFSFVSIYISMKNYKQANYDEISHFVYGIGLNFTTTLFPKQKLAHGITLDNS